MELVGSGNVPHRDVGSGTRTTEVLELCDKLLGRWGVLMYNVALCFLAYSGLVAYAQVFIQSGSLYGDVSAEWMGAFFSLAVVPLSCMDLLETAAVQVSMAVMRGVALAVMIGGAITTLATGGAGSAASGESDSAILGESSMMPPLAQWSGFSIIFSTALFSQLFQHSVSVWLIVPECATAQCQPLLRANPSIHTTQPRTSKQVPGLLQPLSLEARRSSAGKVFVSALATTCILYIAIGCLCAVAFGPAILPSCNLNFDGFSWGQRSTPLVLTILSHLAVLFPAFDTLSVFPLIANTLGNNLASFYASAALKFVLAEF